MKYTLLLLSAGSVGLALPKAACDASAKLRFVPAPEGSGETCPAAADGTSTSRVYSEDKCGTKRFCRAIGAFGVNSTDFTFDPKPVWDTMEACFAAHQQEPKQELVAFDFGTHLDCGNLGDVTEHCDGTLEYCKAIDEIVEFEKSRGGDKFGEDSEQSSDVRWLSTDECLKGHVSEPKDLPFLKGTSPDKCGSEGDESEETCGTEAFCNLFSVQAGDGIKRQAAGSPYIWTKTDCLAAHQKPAGAARF